MAIDTVTPPVPDLVSVDSVLVMMVDSGPDVVSVKMVLDTGSLSLSVTVIQSGLIYMLYTNTVTAKLKGSLLKYLVLTLDVLRTHKPPVRARGLSRECVLRIPSVIVKGD